MTNTNATNLDAIRAKIEAMRNAKKVPTNVEVANLEEAKKDILVPVSAQQITLYTKLCVEKMVQLDPSYKSFDGRKNGTMDKEIQRLIKLPTVKKPSPAQIQLLKDMCARLNCEVPAYAHLTGGREGTFSALIGDLIILEREMTKVAPPTQVQIDTILEMYFCPDVDFSNLHDDYGIVYTGTEGAKMLWTRPSQETVKATLLDLVTFDMASQFIYKYQLEFYKWKTTRPTEGQIKRIRDIQKKCGMMPMDYSQLLQFDKSQADIYIKSIDMVRRDAELCKFAKEKNIEHEYGTKDISEAISKDIEKKENVLYSLYAMAGMNGNEESDTSIDLSNNDDIIIDLAKVVMEVCGDEAVLEILAEAYTLEELNEMFCSESTVEV